MISRLQNFFLAFFFFLLPGNILFAQVHYPQEPNPPFPYRAQEISFINSTGDTLAGTLTMPEKKGHYPAMLLIAGSGPQNRDAQFGDHKPFLVIADYFTKKGFIVLRYDKRGVGQSRGTSATATTADFAADATTAFQFLKMQPEVDSTKIGLVGHSEGGLIAPMVAAAHKDIAFMVLLAAPGVRGSEVLVDQQVAIAVANGKDKEEIKAIREVNEGAFEIIQQYTDSADLVAHLRPYVADVSATDKDRPAGMDLEKYVDLQLNALLHTWMLYFLRYDPGPTLQQVQCPVLALNGINDLQVTPEPNLDRVQTMLQLGGNANVTARKLPGLNHMFQDSETGLPSEYQTNPQTFSPVVLVFIAAWLKKQLP